jgi:hypothetical protein
MPLETEPIAQLLMRLKTFLDQHAKDAMLRKG